MTYDSFIFKDYIFDSTSKTLTCEYALDDALTFTETFTFKFNFVDYDQAVLDRALQNVFFMAGVSYYKTYLPPQIIVEKGVIDESLAAFLAKTYQKGLGEFFYVNHLNPETISPFNANTDQTLNMLSVNGSGSLVGLGGGKDSLVSIELFREYVDITSWSLGHATQLTPLIETTKIPHLQVSRQWDEKLSDLNNSGAYNGHVPISAILACVGVVVAVLAGKRDVVVSNENSANEPTLIYNGISINHQYSKSLEFEKDFQSILAQQFGDSIRYYSLLRPLSELYISEIFAELGFTKYRHVFSSCNRAFTHVSNHMFWCGECPKCAFVFLALTPFIPQTQLEELFGKNLLHDQGLIPTYKQLLGIEGDKPLECVGEIKESRAAMRLATTIYPELSDRYTFELPEDYTYKALASHAIPAEVYQQVFSQL